MKKLMLAFVLLLGVVVSVKAQSIYGDKVKTDVKMKYIYSFEEALKKAREVNKPIFVNCFADWANWFSVTSSLPTGWTGIS